MINPSGMGTEVGRAGGLSRGSDAEQGCGARPAPVCSVWLLFPGGSWERDSRKLFLLSPQPPDEGSVLTPSGAAAASPLPLPQQGFSPFFWLLLYPGFAIFSLIP